MRVLITSSTMAGHFGPLVPFIAACATRGDQLLVVVPESGVARARETGAEVIVGGAPDPREIEDLWNRFRSADQAEASLIANREIFGRLNTAAMLPSVEQAVATHRPDLVLHEATEYAAPIIARRTGVANAQVAISPADAESGSLDLAEPVLRGLGLDVETLRAAPYLTRFPTVIDPSPYPDTRRYRVGSRNPEPLPDWWSGSSEPLVYVTFGTVAATIGTGVYRMAVDALEAVPARVLITTGLDVDLGPLPSHLQVRQWVDQDDVLAQAAVVICHGGSGTTLGALAAGVPMVVLPMFADQARNARALHSLRIARLVEPAGGTAEGRTSYDPATVHALRLAVTELLQDTAIRTRARTISAAIGSGPTPVDLLSELS